MLATAVAAGSLLVPRDGDVSLSRHPDPGSITAPLRRRQVLGGVVGVVSVGDLAKPVDIAATGPRQRWRVDLGPQLSLVQG